MVRQRVLRLPVPPAPALRGLHAPVVHGVPARRAGAGPGARTGAAEDRGVEEARVHGGAVQQPVLVSEINASLFPYSTECQTEGM